jgi:hypothetical protein
MAFQTGTQIRPELGRADVSGFAASGQAIGQGLMMAGQAVAASRAKKKQAEQEKIQLDNLGTVLFDLSERFGGQEIISSPEEGRLFAKTLGPKVTADILQSLQESTPFQPREVEIGGVPYAEVQQGKFSPIPSKTSTLSESEQEINRLMELNIPRSDAILIKEGVIKIVTDPITGKTSKINLNTNEITPFIAPTEIVTPAVNATLSPLEEDDSPSSINLYKIAGSTTGFLPNVQAKLQRLTGQFGIDIASDELLEDIQTFETAQSDLRRSLRTAPKFLASEMAMLSKELDITPGALKDAKTLEAQIRSVDKSIRNRLEDLDNTIKDETLPVEEATSALRIRNDLINFLRILGVPQSVQEEGTDKSLDDLINQYSGKK